MISCKRLLLGVALLLAGPVSAQADTPAGDDPAVRQKKESAFGDVMLRLGRGLLKEVGRRLNLEETPLVTVKKEIAPDGREKYRVDTGKFSFTVRKKARPETQNR